MKHKSLWMYVLASVSMGGWVHNLWMLLTREINVLTSVCFLICFIIWVYWLGYAIFDKDEEIIHCSECKYSYPPVCTLHKDLPMISRNGYCYRARRGKYEGGVPTVEKKDNDAETNNKT